MTEAFSFETQDLFDAADRASKKRRDATLQPNDGGLRNLCERRALILGRRAITMSKDASAHR
jgi:hypothetical protein